MRISDWSSDVCSSDLPEAIIVEVAEAEPAPLRNRPLKPVDPASQLATAGDATALSVDAEVLTNNWAVQVGAFSRFKAAHVSAKEALEMAAQIGRASCRERGCPYV